MLSAVRRRLEQLTGRNAAQPGEGGSGPAVGGADAAPKPPSGGADPAADADDFTDTIRRLYNRPDRDRPHAPRRREAFTGKMMLFTERPAAPRQDQGMQFKLVEIDGEGRVHVAVEGEMTSADVENTNPLEGVVGQRWAANRVLVDMSRVSYIDSMAIGWLINCHKKFQEAGGRIVLHSIPSHVRQIFDLLKISLLFPLAENRESACRAANGEGSP